MRPCGVGRVTVDGSGWPATGLGPPTMARVIALACALTGLLALGLGLLVGLALAAGRRRSHRSRRSRPAPRRTGGPAVRRRTSRHRPGGNRRRRARSSTPGARLPFGDRRPGRAGPGRRGAGAQRRGPWSWGWSRTAGPTPERCPPAGRCSAPGSPRAVDLSAARQPGPAADLGAREVQPLGAGFTLVEAADTSEAVAAGGHPARLRRQRQPRAEDAGRGDAACWPRRCSTRPTIRSRSAGSAPRSSTSRRGWATWSPS